MKDDGGREDEVVSVEFDGFTHGELESSRTEEDVAVGEENPGRCCAVCSGSEGVRLAEPACGEFSDVDDFELVGAIASACFGGNCVHDAAGAISGAVIDGDDLEFDAGRCEERAEALAYNGFFV